MAYIVTRAVENAGKLKAGKIDLEQAVRIPLGHSMNHFLQAIGVTGRGTGGATGNLANIREQLLRLADARVTVKEDDGVRARGKHTEVSRVLFLGICLDFHYFLGRVGFPKL